MVANLNFAYSRRSACEYQIAYFERDILADMFDELIDRENHIRVGGLLYNHTVFFQRKTYWRSDFVYIDKLAYYSRIVKGFGYLPRRAFSAAFGLQVTRGEIDTKPHLGVVSVSKTRCYIFPDAIDAIDEFALILNLLRKVGEEKRFVVPKKCGIGF